MKITDQQVLKWIRKIDCSLLDDDIAYYPEDEREGRTDIQFFADELSYILSLHQPEEDHQWYYDLADARRLLRETKNGRVRPLDLTTFRPKYGYNDCDINRAKQIVGEYNRMMYRYKKLKEMGYYGQWF